MIELLDQSGVVCFVKSGKSHNGPHSGPYGIGVNVHTVIGGSSKIQRILEFRFWIGEEWDAKAVRRREGAKGEEFLVLSFLFSLCIAATLCEASSHCQAQIPSHLSSVASNALARRQCPPKITLVGS